MESAVNEMKPYLTTQRLLEKFLLLYTELHNTMRMPENYGHTRRNFLKAKESDAWWDATISAPAEAERNTKSAAAET